MCGYTSVPEDGHSCYKCSVIGCFQHVGLAKQFEQLVRQDARFDVTNDVTLGLVCFRIKVRHLFRTSTSCLTLDYLCYFELHNNKYNITIHNLNF